MGKISDIIILGAGGHGRSIADVIEEVEGFRIVGFLDDYREKGTSFCDYAVLGKFKSVPNFVSVNVGFAIGIGQIETPKLRKNLFDLVTQSGGAMPSVVSPHSYVSPNAAIGRGTSVFHGAVVNAGAVIGENCIVNSMALIEHDVRIEDHCHISTGARVNGGVEVGEGSFVGSGAVILHGKKISPFSIIPAGTSFR